MYRNRVTVIVLAFIISQASTMTARISNEVNFGTTQDLMKSSQENSQKYNDTKIRITSIVQTNQQINPSYAVIHYETELGPSANLKAENFIQLLTEADPNARLLLTIRISTLYDLSTEQVAGKEYLSLLNTLSRHTIKLEGISIELTTIEKFCDGKLPDMKSLTGITKASLKNRFSNARVGYVLNLRNIDCTFHLDNIKTADFIILKLPMQRNGNIFVESYNAFKANIENYINSNMFQILNRTNIYYQLNIQSEITVSQAGYRLSADGREKVFLKPEEQTELQNIKSSLDDFNQLIGSAYEDLLTQYCLQWIMHDQPGINAIISYQYGLQNINPPEWDHVTVIPYLTMLPLRNTNKNLQLPQSASFLFQDVRESGFNIVMINGDDWQELSKNKRDYIMPCHQPKCRPEKVMYFNNEQNAFAKLDTHEIRKLAYIDEMNLTTLVFSPDYSESQSRTRKWTGIVDIIKGEGGLIKSMEKTCVEQSNFFENITAQVFNSCDNTCHALNLKVLTGCGSLKIYSPNIMWQGIIQIENYNVSSFVENIMKRLDSLVIARQLLREKYFKTTAVFVKIIFNHTRNPPQNENNFPVYCNSFYGQVYQYYEMILTWARIHAFPIIIDSTGNKYGFTNPISWQPLSTSRSVIIKGLMTSSPLFIRRSYNLSTVFGSEWTKGMYPCLQHANNVVDLQKLNFNHDFSGVTINMDLRTNGVSMTLDELKVILLFSLGKFNAVEIILLTESHSQTLLDVLSEPHFDKILKQNGIQNKKLYLQIFSYQHKFISDIISKLHQFRFQVHISMKTSQYLDHVTENNNILGTVQESCTSLAQKVISDRNDSSLKILSTNISYLICETFSIPARNSDKKSMHEYLETHLYMRKLFQYFYPNLKEVRFRLHPLISERRTQLSKIDMLNETLFLADVNNFAQGHQVHYFMLPVLPRENTTESQQSSFWSVKNYQDLSDLSNYEEKLAAVLNVTFWKPTPTWIPPTTPNPTTIGKSLNSTNPPEHLSPGPSPLIIYFSVGAASVASIVVTFFVIMKARRSNNYLSEKEVKDFFYGKMETLEKAANERKLSISVKKSSNVYDGLVYQKDCEISKNDINLNRKSICISGKFCSKFRAKLQNGRDGEVLVEICTKKNSKDKFKAWMSEVKMLCYVGSHNNIVSFMGCYTSELRNGVLWVVTEFCQEGSLENHLKAFKDTLNVGELTRFACEIAIGLEYISSQNIIHGDLRARHVYLDQHKVCKVGDFGLSRKLLQFKAVVKKGKRERLPWRWMPCEALQNLEFSVYSDVWSYGVTLWEIFSLAGEVPYGEEEIFSQTFVAQVMKGKRLSCPSQATPEIFGKMQECWTLDPEMRSEFKDLVKSFSGMLTSKTDV